MIEILYDCPLFTVAVKPAGFLSEEGEGSFPALLKQELSLPRLYPVHRLDRVVSGVMVYAKTPQVAAELSKERALTKTYLTVVKGVGLPPEGELSDLLFKDSKKN
ncbi:MAG: RNA pseudouridine synthase, partial [Clostridia bacterium]|nr:RNA pseudouridine synthase [Clostridia bacterium]